MTMEMFKNLIGARLVEINNEGFTIKMNNGNLQHFIFEEDPGDCCGYSEVTTKLLIDKNDLRTMPAITNVEWIKGEEGEGEAAIITLFGINKQLAEIDSYSSSGSGWCYGSTMSVRCKETGEEEIITSW